jgi:hypothetical protein
MASRDRSPLCLAISGRKAAWGRFVVQTGGLYLFVSGNGPAQIQVVNLSDLS